MYEAYTQNNRKRQTGMNIIEFKRLMAVLGGLSASECIEAKSTLRNRERQVESDVVLREFEQQVKSCPHCKGCELRSTGSKDGRKRFKCVACSKTFNAYTGTSLARLKMADKHIEHAELMVEGWSLRKVAEKLSVDLHTAFLWRHRFLKAARDAQPAKLSGVVEVDETFFLESFKGQRSGIPRPSKTRGEPAKQRGLSKEQIPVLVARDRSTGATLTAKLQDRSSKQIGACLVPVLDKDVGSVFRRSFRLSYDWQETWDRREERPGKGLRWQLPRQQRERLRQPPQRLDVPLPWRGDQIPRQLPWLALHAGKGRQERKRAINRRFAALILESLH